MRRVSLGSWLICLLSQVFGGSDRDVPLRAELPMKTPPDSHVDNKEVADDAEESDANWNVTFKTFGGRQFWGDVRFFRGWRIQQNVITKHYRLLDSEDRRQAWGTLEQCAQKLEKSKRDLHLAPMSGKAVVLVHGIIRSSKSLNSLKQRLTEEGYTVVGFDYPSTRVTIPESADYLQQVLSSLEGIVRSISSFTAWVDYWCGLGVETMKTRE